MVCVPAARPDSDLYDSEFSFTMDTARPDPIDIVHYRTVQSKKHAGIHFSAIDKHSLSVYYKEVVTSTTSRYNWDKWLIVPSTTPVEKKSFQIMKSGLAALPMFAD